MLCSGNVNQHAGSTYERCRAEKREQAKLQAQADPLGKKVAVIDMMDYGMMKGDAVLEKALKLLES